MSKFDSHSLVDVCVELELKGDSTTLTFVAQLCGGIHKQMDQDHMLVVLRNVEYFSLVLNEGFDYVGHSPDE